MGFGSKEEGELESNEDGEGEDDENLEANL